MPLTLLDGTSATVDLTATIGDSATSSSSRSSFRCVTSAIQFRTTRQYQEATTLCSGQDVTELPGRRQSFINISKFASQGTNISDLSPMFSATQGANVVFTAATGCTKIGAFWADEDSSNIAAGQVAMPGSVSLRSTGGVASAWVIT